MRKPLTAITAIAAFVLAITVSALSQDKINPPDARRCVGIAVVNDQAFNIIYRAFEDGRIESFRQQAPNAKWEPLK